MSEIENETSESEIEEEKNTNVKIPITEESVNKWYAAYFTDRNPYYTWGKVKRIFTNDEEDEYAEKVELDFLKKKILSSNPKDVKWQEKPQKEVIIIESRYIFFGPECPDIDKGVFTFKNEVAAYEEFSNILNM